MVIDEKEKVRNIISFSVDTCDNSLRFHLDSLKFNENNAPVGLEKAIKLPVDKRNLEELKLAVEKALETIK